MRTLLCLSLLFSLNSFGSLTEKPVAPKKNFDFGVLAEVPVQSGGRIKPFQSYAHEILLFMTERRNFKGGWHPVDIVLSWVVRKDHWDNVRFLKIKSKDVRRQLLLDSERMMYSPKELFQSEVVQQYLYLQGQEGATATANTLKFDPKEAELKKVVNRLYTYHNLLKGSALPLVPRPNQEAWRGIDSLVDDKSIDDGDKAIRDSVFPMFKAYIDGDASRFLATSKEVRTAVEGRISNWSDNQTSVGLEQWYNVYRPFRLAWIAYLLAALLFMISYPVKGDWGKRYERAGFILTAFGVLAHVVGFTVRCYIAGRPPVSNMYESVVWVSLGIFMFAYYLYWKQRQKILPTVAATLGAFSLIAADVAPAVLDPSIHTLVPVLRSTLWLTVHVLTITLSYAAFALCLGLGNISLWHFYKKGPGWKKKTSDLNQLTYRATQFGVVLIAAGTILGGVWADYSWGRFWGWDPKEVWALIVLLAYVAVLHGRYAGWVGQFGFAAISVVAFTTVLMAWYGVNFVLGAGLHAYGFSAGGQAWVLGFTLAQLGFVAYVTFHYKMRLKAA